MTYSTAIDKAILLARAEGNAVVEISTGWVKVREVVHMQDPLSCSLRAKILGIAGLREWAAQPTPHNRAEAGFIDDVEKVSISFPVGTIDKVRH
jgi:hypothetical protein